MTAAIIIGFAFVLLIAAKLWPVSNRPQHKYPSLPEKRQSF